MEVNLDALINPGVEIGVPGGTELIAFSNALISANKSSLDEARDDLENTLGSASISAASAIAANFSKNDRIANGLGIPHDPVMLKATEEIRAQLKLDDFRSATNSLKYLSVA